MTKFTQYLTGLVAAVALVMSGMPAQAQSTLTYSHRSAYHITTNTTTAITASDAYLVALVINCIVAGASSYTCTVRNKESTPKVIFYALNLAVGTTVIQVSTKDAAILMKSGIEVVTATGTAPTADVFVTYYTP
jgi:hypothetical protein